MASGTRDEHLIAIPGGPFAAWRWTALRGAGFPAELVLRLAAPRSSALADAVAAEPRAPRERLEELRAALATERVEVSRFLRSVAADARFREALAWQNRNALATGVDVLARSPADVANARTRPKERLVATYLQRYCAKNETAGFFGPFGWARFEDDQGFTMTPGRALVAERITYFETWCIDALAEHLAKRWDLRAWTCPRVVPYGYFDGAALHLPFSEPIPLPPLEARAVSACDGQRTAREIAELVLRDPAGGGSSEREVFEALERAQNRGAILWTLDVPFGLGSARALRRELERIDDSGIRGAALAMLDELEQSAEAAHSSADDAGATCAALESLDEKFAELTGARATRADGSMYAARTVLYQDCRRDIELRIGRQVIDRAGPSLSLVLTSARWYTHEIAGRVRRGARQLFEMLRGGGETVPLLAFYGALTSGGVIPAAVNDTRAELSRRWASILGPFDAEAREVRFRSEDLAPKVRDVFVAPGPGWSVVRHFSPDIMIAARSAEAIARGDYRVVLGEMHAANLLSSTAAVITHPRKEELFRAMTADLGPGLVMPVVPRNAAASVRLDWHLVPDGVIRFLASPDRADVPRDRLLTAGELLVRAEGDALVVCDRAGDRCFDLVDFLGVILFSAAVNFDFLPSSATHEPRVLFDDLVVRRERWRFAANEVPFARVEDADERFLAARRFRMDGHLPRFVFVRSAVERKPYFLDFDSPILLDVTAKLVRAASAASPPAPVAFTEMLPDFDELWLEDAEGRRYTSELRVATLDPAAPSFGAEPGGA